jgi:release factor glutamine methyltransferase
MQISQALEELAIRLSGVSETPSLDAQTVLAHVLGATRAWVLAHPEASLSPKQENALNDALARLEGGEPLPYVLGHWEFYGLDFIVSPAVLIPRPETEMLVERALEWLRLHPGRRVVADIGTGSGCIAVSLAVNIPDLHVLATDVSLQALEVAKTNAEKHNVSECIQFIHADLLNLPPSAFNLQPVDLITANLPYIPTSRLENLDVARREPRLALDGGADGLALIQRLLMTAPSNLAPGGMCLLEIDTEHGESAQAIARVALPQAEVSVTSDLAGHNRLLIARLPD